MIKSYFSYLGKICKEFFESPQAVKEHKRSAHSNALSKSEEKVHNMQSTISGDLVRSTTD